MMANVGATAATIVALLGTVVTAIATVFLWRVTKTLAVETKRMAEASARPQVVAHIEPNRWAGNHADLRVANTGNATAFDIRISFDPPLERDGRHAERPTPFQQISVLKPGQELMSHLGTFQPLLKKVYALEISWKRHPAAAERETLDYTFDMNDIAGMSHLGPAEPLTQIAQQMKKMREDWQYVASGSRRLRVDGFTARDRQAEDEAAEQAFERFNETYGKPEASEE